MGSAQRDRPGWDGGDYPVVGVGDGQRMTLSIPPSRVRVVAALGEDLELIGGRLADLIDRPGRRFGRGVFRWSTAPVPFPDAGEWVSPDDGRLPDWLRIFPRDVLVAWDEDGRVAAGVGLKPHDRFGQELSVVTEPAARGRGLARRLVAQAARRVLDEGAVPTYLHHPANHASARVAEAAGFADQGWSVYGLPTPS